MSILQIHDKTLNESYLNSQFEKIINELTAFAQLQDGENLRTFEGTSLDKEAGIKFIEYKKDIIRLIENSDRKALENRLEFLKTKLCKDCRRGLENYEVRCKDDYLRFIACEYIKRSLS